MKNPSAIQFGEIQHYRQVIGTVSDVTGQYRFKLYLTSSKDGELEKFVRYVEDDTIRFRITVIEHPADNFEDDFPQSPLKPDWAVSEADQDGLKAVNIGLSRVDEDFKNLARPYRICYEIDPNANWVPLIDRDPSGSFGATFSGETRPCVKCWGYAGAGIARLYQVDDRGQIDPNNPVASAPIQAHHSVMLNFNNGTLANWKVVVTGDQGQGVGVSVAYLKTIQ